MDLADNTLRVGDIIALSGSLVGVIVSYIRVQIKAESTESRHEEHREETKKWITEVRGKVHDMANHITANGLRSAINTEKIEGHERDLEAIRERQAYFDSKVLDKLERLQKDLARIEGKMGLIDNR